MNTRISFSHRCIQFSYMCGAGAMPAPFGLCGNGAAKVLHTHALPGVGSVVSREHIFREDDISHEPVMDHHTLGAVSARALRLIHVDPVNQFPQQRRCQRIHLHELPMKQFRLYILLWNFQIVVHHSVILCNFQLHTHSE